MLASLADNTLKQYDSCLKQWYLFNQGDKIDIYNAPVTSILKFLVELFNKGGKYGTINSAKSALSLILGSDSIKDPQIRRFMKAVYKLRTPLPKYNITWDPTIVLNYLSNWYPNEGLSFEILSKKLITLLALVTAHRVQTLSLIRISNIRKIGDKRFAINVTDRIKTSVVNNSQPTLILPYFDEQPAICPARTLERYLIVSSEKRQTNCDYLIISFRKPYKKVCSQSISRWIKATLKESRIDIATFGAHSTRHAATSAANRLGVSVELIRKTAGWTDSSRTYAKFYNRNLAIDNSDVFARSLCRLASTNSN